MKLILFPWNSCFSQQSTNGAHNSFFKMQAVKNNCVEFNIVFRFQINMTTNVLNIK